MSESKAMEAYKILPTDCWESIFSCLSDDDLGAVSLVCKDFLKLSNLFKDNLTVIHPSVGMLSKLLKRFKHITKIDLRHIRGDVYEFILEIARSDFLDMLDTLYCDDYFFFLSGCLELLDSNPKMKNLKALNMKCYTIDDLEEIANSFPNLEQLAISGIDCVFGSDCFHRIEVLAPRLKFLKTIHIFFDWASDELIIALSLNCVFLKDFSIDADEEQLPNESIAHNFTEYGIGFLIRNRPNLEALSVQGVYLFPTVYIENSFSYAKALTSLVLCDMNSNLLRAIAEANLPLKKFVVKSWVFIVSDLLMLLSNYQLSEFRIQGTVDGDLELLFNGDVDKITHMEISCKGVTSKILFLLATMCPSLLEIEMSNLYHHNLEFNNIPMPTNRKVQNLYFRCSTLTDQLIKQFGIIFPNLKSLDFSGCHGEISSTGIEAILKSCKFLRELIFNYYPKAKIIEAGNSVLSQVNLEDLKLSVSLIDDEGLSAIAKRCLVLQCLDLYRCKVITVKGIKEIIEHITTLKYLYIDGCFTVNRLRDLLKWMLSTGNLASLKKIRVGLKKGIIDDLEDELLCHGCLLF